MKQTTHTVLMIEPRHFGFNPEAADTNSFQQLLHDFTPQQAQDMALLEFKNAVQELQAFGVEVLVFRDPESSCYSDSVFPNNWFSTHPEGKIVTYPMFLKSRRAERREDIVSYLQENYGFEKRIALEKLEQEAMPAYLEGTGSLVLDRVNRLAYAALSPRTQLPALQKFCEQLGYTALSFRAYGPGRELIYHTNVVMCIGQDFAIAGMDAIDAEDRQKVHEALESSGRKVIELTQHQVHHCFAGNMLQLENKQQQTILAMSKAAYESLSDKQLASLQSCNDHILALPVHMIEKCGGGSVRCMLAEIFPGS